jgi:hypothetical protein
MGRARCEWHKSIDVRDWQRQGLLTPGTFFSQTWTSDDEPSCNIGVFVRDGRVTLVESGKAKVSPSMWMESDCNHDKRFVVSR